MFVKQTNGNSKNKIKGSRLRIYGGGMMVDEFVVPIHNARAYCERYPNGRYGRRYHDALSMARNADAAMGEVC